MASVDRIHRLLRLIELLQSGRAYNTAQLAALCDVSRRTVFRDLSTIQDSGIRVHYDDDRQGYVLPAATRLPPTEFTLAESLALLVLSHELGGGRHSLPFLKPARDAALKLLSNLPPRFQEYLSQVTATLEVQLDPHNPLEGAEQHYELLMRALSERRQVRIRYGSLTEWEEISTLLSPYRILFNRRSWYVIGRSSLHRSVRTFNIGRIRAADLVDSKFQIPPRFTLERHLGNAWNLIRELDERHDVVIRFQKQVATNVAEVRWHKTQRIVHHDDGTIDYHVTVDGLGEISWWVLGYGDQAEVLQPRELRDIIRNHIKNLSAAYSE